MCLLKHYNLLVWKLDMFGSLHACIILLVCKFWRVGSLVPILSAQKKKKKKRTCDVAELFPTFDVILTLKTLWKSFRFFFFFFLGQIIWKLTLFITVKIQYYDLGSSLSTVNDFSYKIFVDAHICAMSWSVLCYSSGISLINLLALIWFF